MKHAFKLHAMFKLTTAALLISCSLAYARAGYVALPDKIAASDLIARVEVLSTTQVVPTFVQEKDGRPVFRRLQPGEYRSAARVRVLQSIKGLKAGEIYTLEFDNGAICPNVRYKAGEVCLVFNTRRPNGHYETFNTQYGKYTIQEDLVAGWKLNSEQAVPFDEVVSEISVTMQTPGDNR